MPVPSALGVKQTATMSRIARRGQDMALDGRGILLPGGMIVAGAVVVAVVQTGWPRTPRAIDLKDSSGGRGLGAEGWRGTRGAPPSGMRPLQPTTSLLPRSRGFTRSSHTVRKAHDTPGSAARNAPSGALILR